MACTRHDRRPSPFSRARVRTQRQHRNRVPALRSGGGITSYMEMPNCNPQTTNAEALQRKCDRAAKHSLANYGFYLGATNDNLEDVKSLDPTTACGIKVFMGASTGNMLVDDPDTLNGIFASAPILIAPSLRKYPHDFSERSACSRRIRRRRSIH
ncbi:MAG: hypothetical protein Ct9H300mP8_12860 [Gammaproteobacteria bacterium]|nr:MAG: hypothetical protein Ct9H300mP8_12860 [Gammaproteobacteria bacterium]